MPEVKPEITENESDDMTTKPTTLSTDTTKYIAIVEKTSTKTGNPTPSLRENGEKKSINCEVINKEQQQTGKIKRSRNRRKPGDPPGKPGRPRNLSPKAKRLRDLTSRQGICPICGKYLTDLMPHMQTHEMVTPVECDYCNRKFARKNSLAAHFKSHFNPRFVYEQSI